MLPDNLADQYDGTMESLYAIIENSLEISASLVKSEKIHQSQKKIMMKKSMTIAKKMMSH